MASKKAPAPAGANLKTSKYASLNLNSLHKPVAAPVVPSAAKPAQKGLIVLGVPGKDKKSTNSKLFEPPKPVQLGSLKAENRGLDPTINLVPAGGLGWGKKADTTPKASPEQTSKAEPSAPPKFSMPKAAVSARADSKGDVEKDKPSDMSRESDTPKAQSPSWGGWGKTPKAGSAVTGKVRDKDFPTLSAGEAAASALPTSAASAPPKPSREEADVEEAAPARTQSRTETGGARASTVRRGASWADQDGADDSDHSSGRGRGGGGGGRGSAGSDTSDGPVKETRSRPSKASRSELREKRRTASKEEVDDASGGKSRASSAKDGPPPGGGSSGSKDDVLPADQRAWMREAALRRAAERRKEEDAILAEQRARAAEKLRALDERAAEKKRQKEAEAATEATPEPKAEARVETKAEEAKPVKPRKTWENLAETQAVNGPALKKDIEDSKPESEVSSRDPTSASGQRNGTQGRGWHTSTEEAVTPKPADVAAVVQKPVSLPDQAATPPESNQEAPVASRSEAQSAPKSSDVADPAPAPAPAASAEAATAAADDDAEVPKWQKPAKPTRGDSDSDWRRRDDRYWKGREAAPAEEAQADCVDDQATVEKAKEQRPAAPAQARAGQAAPPHVRAGQAAASQARAGVAASGQAAPTQARASQSVAEKAKPPTMLQQGAAVEPSTEPAARAAARAVERAGGSVWAARAEAQALLEAAKLKEEEEKKKAEEEAAAARAKEKEEAAAAAKALRRKEAQWQDDAADEAGGKGKGKGKGRKAKGKGSYAADGEAEAQGEEEETGRAKGRSKGEKGGRAEKSGKAEKGAGKAEKGAGKAEKGSAKGKGKGKAKAAWEGEEEVEGKGKGKKGRQRWVVKDAQENWYSKYDEEDYGWQSSLNKDYSWDSKWARRKGSDAASSTVPAGASAAEAGASADAEAQEQPPAPAEARESRSSRSQRHAEQSWTQRASAPAREEKGSHEVQENLPARPEHSAGATATSERRGGAGNGGVSSGTERKREGQTKPSTVREEAVSSSGRDAGRDGGRDGGRNAGRGTGVASQEAQPPPPRRPPPQPPAEPKKPKEADRQLVRTLNDIGDSGFSVGAGVVCVKGDTEAAADDDAEGDDEFQTVKSKKQQKAEKAEKKRLAEEEAKKEAKREAKRNKRREAAGSAGEEAAVPSKASQEPSKDLGGRADLPQDEASALEVNAPAAGRQAPSSSMPSAVRGEVSEQSNESAGGASGSGSPAIGPLHMSGGFPSFGPFGAIGSLSAQPSKEIAAIWERPTAAPGFRAPPPFPVGHPSQPSTSSGGRPLRPVGKPPPYAPPVPARPLLRRQALQWANRQAAGPLDAETSEVATSATAPARPGTKQEQADFAPSSSSSRRPKDASAPSADGAAQGGGRSGRGRGGRGRGADASGAARAAPSAREDADDAPKGRSFYSEKGGKRSKGRDRGEKGGEKGDNSAGKRESYYAAHGEMAGGRPGRDASANEGGTASTSAQGKAASRSGDGQRGRGRGKGSWRDAEADQQPRDEGTQRGQGERGSQARSSGSAADRAEDAPRSRGRGKGRGRSQGDTAYSENPRVNGTSGGSRAEGSATADSETRGRGGGRGGRRGGKMMYKPKAASTS